MQCYCAWSSLVGIHLSTLHPNKINGLGVDGHFMLVAHALQCLGFCSINPSKHVYPIGCVCIWLISWHQQNNFSTILRFNGIHATSPHSNLLHLNPLWSWWIGGNIISCVHFSILNNLSTYIWPQVVRRWHQTMTFVHVLDFFFPTFTTCFA